VAGGLVAAALLVGVGATIWQARIAAHERDLAREEARMRQGVSDALIDILSVARPGETGVDAAAARQVLDYALQRAESEFAGQPKLHAQLVTYVGFGYNELGHMQRAVDVLARAESLCVSAYGPRSLEVADVKERRASAVSSTGDLESARRLHTESLVIRREQVGDDDVLLAANYDALGGYARFREQNDSAEHYGRLALDLRLATLGPLDPSVATSYNNLALTYRALGREDEAERSFRHAIAIWEEIYGIHPNIGQAWHNLGLLVLNQGRLTEAEEMVRKSVFTQRELKMEGSVLANDLNTLGTVLVQGAEYKEAERVIREALQLNIDTRGDRNRQVAASHLSLSRALVGLGKLEEAIVHSRQGYEIFRELYGDQIYVTAAALAYYGNAQWRAGHRQEGRRRLEESLESLRDAGTTAVTYRASAALWLSELDLQENRLAEAEALQREAVRVRLSRHPEGSFSVAGARSLLGLCLARQGRMAEADSLLRLSCEQLNTSLGPDHVLAANARARLDSISSQRTD